MKLSTLCVRPLRKLWTRCHLAVAVALPTLALAGLVAAVPGSALADESGWRACADEGQACRVSGRAVVRYGAEGRWTTRSVIDGIQCGNDAFGDPAPDVPKRCEVRVSGHGGGSGGGNQAGSGAAGWSFCAAEGEVCRFRGQSQVRFGQGDRFVTRTAYGSVRCDVADFGDPAFGVTKFCEVRSAQANASGNSSSGSWSGWGNGSATSGWRYCAAEGGTCRVSGRAQVRFGDGRRFNTRSANGEIRCDAEVFGDPAFGVVKHCEVQASSFNNGDTAGWSRCARENERCEFSGSAQVRYGVAGRYVYRDARNGLTCNTDSFGSDPYENRVKTCEIRR